MGKIEPDFFDLEIYAIYKAAFELLGDETWKVVWRAGEIAFEELRRRFGWRVEGDPFPILEDLADYLQKAGYVEHIKVRRLCEDTVEYEMLNPVIATGAKRLIDQGMVPAHVSTALMFAVLKQFDMKATMVGDPVFKPDGRVLERWKLSKSASP